MPRSRGRQSDLLANFVNELSQQPQLANIHSGTCIHMRMSAHEIQIEATSAIAVETCTRPKIASLVTFALVDADDAAQLVERAFGMSPRGRSQEHG